MKIDHRKIEEQKTNSDKYEDKNIGGEKCETNKGDDKECGGLKTQVFSTATGLSDSAGENELRIIGYQLGRVPVGVKSVASYCKYGCPQVIKNETFKEGTPFPTLFWLTCPVLVKAVSRIEGQGWSDIMRNRIKEDSDLREKLLSAHDSYRRMRKESTAKEPTINVEIAYDHAVFSTGIGGVRDTEGVKCLHAHYAHYLATGENPLGEMVDKMLADYECERRCSAL